MTPVTHDVFPIWVFLENRIIVSIANWLEIHVMHMTESPESVFETRPTLKNKGNILGEKKRDETWRKGTVTFAGWIFFGEEVEQNPEIHGVFLLAYLANG